MLLGHFHALFCAGFSSICHSSVLESVGEVFKFTIAAAYKTDVNLLWGNAVDWRDNVREITRAVCIDNQCDGALDKCVSPLQAK